MTWSRENDEQCEALFASALQQSDTLSAEVISDEINRVVSQFGVAGCASRMAQEFGDHPEAACQRMQWVRRLISEVLPGSARQLSQSPLLTA
jgi:hypothetical protein